MYNKNYNHYQRARNAAWNTLITCSINSLPIDLHKITSTLGIKVHLYSKSSLPERLGSEAKNGDGFITKHYNQKHIYLNDAIKNINRRRFTLAHELAHGILDHPLEFTLYRNSEIDNPASPIEFEANICARDILMPACILKELQIHTPEQIMELCNVSKISAEIRAKRMEVLYQRNAFYKSHLEQQVLHNFKNFLESFK